MPEIPKERIDNHKTIFAIFSYVSNKNKREIIATIEITKNTKEYFFSPSLFGVFSNIKY